MNRYSKAYALKSYIKSTIYILQSNVGEEYELLIKKSPYSITGILSKMKAFLCRVVRTLDQFSDCVSFPL